MKISQNKMNLAACIMAFIAAFVTLVYSARGATPAQLKTTADSLQAVADAADSAYKAALNRAGASRCSSFVQAYLDTAASTAKIRYSVKVLANPSDSMYVRLKSSKGGEMYLITQTVQAKGLYTSITQEGDYYIALIRRDRALQGLGMMEAVATGNYSNP